MLTSGQRERERGQGGDVKEIKAQKKPGCSFTLFMSPFSKLKKKKKKVGTKVHMISEAGVNISPHFPGF